MDEGMLNGSNLNDHEIHSEERPLEKSPQGRYVRFGTKLGSGAYKTVYRAYDTDQGIDVAWNAIDIGILPSGEKTRIIQEVQLLQKLVHKNIINFYGSWFSKEKNQVVFITEIMTSGTLKSYIKRVQFIKWKIIKRWCTQILEGLQYLHRQDPPIIHRDLKCDNIFINGNTGDLRIGDLGLSTQMAVQQRAQSVLGTPEFMAPELYDENYDEKVDIYAFGMCVLEMVTKDVPYSECTNPAQIYKKVIAGIRPSGLQRIANESARGFIELCLSRGNGEIDVTAEYLLQHSFLQLLVDDDQLVICLEDPDVNANRLSRTSTSSYKSTELTDERLSQKLDMESNYNNNNKKIEKSESNHSSTRNNENQNNILHNTLTHSPLNDINYDNRTNNYTISPNDFSPGNTNRPSFNISKDTNINNDNRKSLSFHTNIKEYDMEADQILASMPGNESEIQNERMKVLAGRNHVLDISTEINKNNNNRRFSSSFIGNTNVSRNASPESKPGTIQRILPASRSVSSFDLTNTAKIKKATDFISNRDSNNIKVSGNMQKPPRSDMEPLRHSFNNGSSTNYPNHNMNNMINTRNSVLGVNMKDNIKKLTNKDLESTYATESQNGMPINYLNNDNRYDDTKPKNINNQGRRDSTTSLISNDSNSITNMPLNTTRPNVNINNPSKRYDIKAQKDTENDHSILLTLRIMIDNKSKEIKFSFNLFTDCPHEVASELASDVGILEIYLSDITDSISYLVTEGKKNYIMDCKNGNNIGNTLLLDNNNIDIWEEGPEPFSFSTKPLPHVSKLSINNNLQVNKGYGTSNVHDNRRNEASSVEPEIIDKEKVIIADKNIIKNASFPSTITPAPPPLIYKKDTIEPSKGSDIHDKLDIDNTSSNTIVGINNSKSSNNNNNPSYDFDKSIEMEMRDEEEKHKKEVERYQKKMQEFQLKKQKALLQREQQQQQLPFPINTITPDPNAILNISGLPPLPSAIPAAPIRPRGVSGSGINIITTTTTTDNKRATSSASNIRTPMSR